MKRSLLLNATLFTIALHAQTYRDVFWATYQHKLGNVEQSQEYLTAARDAVEPQNLLSTLLPTLFAQQKFSEVIKELRTTQSLCTKISQTRTLGRKSLRTQW